MTTKNWVTVILGSFLAGAGNWAGAHVSNGVPTGGEQLRAFLVGASIAGFLAVFHLFQTAPADVPKLERLAKIVSKGGLVLWLALASTAVSASGCSVPPAVTGGIVAGVDFGVCVLNVAAQDVGQPMATVINDAITKCGGDALQVARVLDAHQRAMDASLRAR